MRNTRGEADRTENTPWGRRALVAAIAAGSILVPACSDNEPAQDQRPDVPTSTTVVDHDLELRRSGELVVEILKPQAEYFVSRLGGIDSGLVQKAALAPNGENVPDDSVTVVYTVVSNDLELRVYATGQQKPGHPDQLIHGSMSHLDARLVQPGAGEMTSDNPGGDLVINAVEASFVQGDGAIASASVYENSRETNSQELLNRAGALVVSQQAAGLVATWDRDIVGTK